jgi:hypothetical protein
MWLVFTLSFLFFFSLHVGVDRYFSGYLFHDTLKISRGLASVFLSILGFISLYFYFSWWEYGFLLRHTTPEPFLEALVYGLMGHFCADFLWLAYGWKKRESQPRMDLLIHHGFGLFVCIYALQTQLAYAIIGVALTSEMMPVTTGIGALGTLFHQKSSEPLANRLRVFVILGWRLPLWIFVFFRLTLECWRGEARASISSHYITAFSTCLFLIALDSYWSFCCFKKMKTLKSVASS